MAAELVLCLSTQLISASSATATLPPFPTTNSTTQRTTTTFLAATNKPPASRLTCAVSTQDSHLTTSSDNDTRRSANYQPNLWNFEFLHSLDNQLEVERVQERARKLEEKVRGVIKSASDDDDPLTLLEFIDNVHRLGLAYKFDSDITAALIQSHRIIDYDQLGLHATALSFRLLRQHGLPVSQDVFESFKDDKDDGKFKAEISGDVQGLLSLYEASYLCFEGEHLLEEGRAFAAAHLKTVLECWSLLEQNKDPKLAEKVKHALELPYHRRVHRLEARWFIDRYQVKNSDDGVLLELAKLDFNMVQSEMKRELQELSRWWREIGLTSKLDFVRDRLMEVYFWALGMAPDPHLSDCRKAVTKMFGLVTIIDDVYDVYGTLEELQLFTDAVDRWDVNAVDTLPDYMKLCFLALYNTVNDTAYTTLREKGDNSLPYLAKSWRDLCKAFLQEAKWSNNKIIPPFDEYLKNASVSSSGGALLAPCYFSVSQDITSDALHSLTNYDDDEGLVRSSCSIFRLCNDLATSAAELERGETTNSITSYMNENGTSEEEARDSLTKLIDHEWNKMNRDRAALDYDSTTFPKAFKDIAINMARVSHCTYQYGDGLGRPDDTAEKRIKLLLVDPIPIN